MTAGKPHQRSHAEELLDEVLEETFPASDPIAPAIHMPEPVAAPSPSEDKTRQRR
jgi:hypothetical protein